MVSAKVCLVMLICAVVATDFVSASKSSGEKYARGMYQRAAAARDGEEDVSLPSPQDLIVSKDQIHKLIDDVVENGQLANLDKDLGYDGVTDKETLYKEADEKVDNGHIYFELYNLAVDAIITAMEKNEISTESSRHAKMSKSKKAN